MYTLLDLFTWMCRAYVFACNLHSHSCNICIQLEHTLRLAILVHDSDDTHISTQDCLYTICKMITAKQKFHDDVATDSYQLLHSGQS